MCFIYSTSALPSALTEHFLVHSPKKRSVSKKHSLVHDKLEEERSKLDQERSYAQKVRGEREKLKGEVRDLKADLRSSEKKSQEQAVNIQALQTQVLESRKHSREKDDEEIKKEATTALQSQVEKRFRAMIGDMNVIFKASGYVFDPDATSSEEEDDESMKVNPVEANAAVEWVRTNAAVATETERPTEAKDPARPELTVSTAEAAASKAAKPNGDADAKVSPTVLPVTTLASSPDNSSSAS